MSTETRDVLLYKKLQDGLRIDLVSKALAISRAQYYQELCKAAKNEEQRLTELKKWRQYAKGESCQYQTSQTSHLQQTPKFKKDNHKEKSSFRKQARCDICSNLLQLYMQ